MQVVILAAGRGQRLGRLAERYSKPMLPIMGEPMIGRVLRAFSMLAPPEIIVIGSPRDHTLESYLSTLDGKGPAIRLLHQKEPLGTANALMVAADYLGEMFLVSACDHMVEVIELQRFAEAAMEMEHCDALLSIMRMDRCRIQESAAVSLDNQGEVRRVVEKPNAEEAASRLAALPLYAFSRPILEHMCALRPSSRGEYEIPAGIQRLIDGGGRVRAFMWDARMTVNTVAEYLDVHMRLLRRRGSWVSEEALIGQEVAFQAPVAVEAEARLGDGSQIGPLAYICRRAQIGAGSRIVRSVVMPGAEVQPGARIVDQVVHAMAG